MNHPLVSVLLPTNVITPWLDEAVSSILSQKLDLELIVVHDGITPDTTREWVQDPRVNCVVNHHSSGLANALNVGAKHARGQFVARIDGDDLSLPGRLSTQLEVFRNNPQVVLVGTWARIIDEHGNPHGSLRSARAVDVRHELLTRNVLVHSSIMFRRATLEACGGYNAQLRQMEDYDLWLRMASLGEIRVVQEELVEYRVHSNQMSRGAGAFGPHIKAVLNGRRRLAKSLGVSSVAQLTRDFAWWSAQVARSRGWRSPGYAR